MGAAAKLLRGVKQQFRNTTKKEAVPWRQSAATPEEQLSEERRVGAAAKLLRGVKQQSRNTTKKEAVPQAQSKQQSRNT